jgi:hypothetical protein
MIRCGEFKKTNPDLIAVVIGFILLRVYPGFTSDCLANDPLKLLKIS